MYADKLKECMNIGYHSNLLDICKNIGDFIYTLAVLQCFFTMTSWVRMH